MAFKKFSFTMTQAPEHRLRANVGAGLDIQTGEFVKGVRGEWILNGGIAPFSGIAGPGNTFKTAILRYLICRIMQRIRCSSAANLYDTEVSAKASSFQKVMDTISAEDGMDTVDILGESAPGANDAVFTISDESVVDGTQWYEQYRENLELKHKNAKSFTVTSPFWNRELTGPYCCLVPTASAIDSLTDFKTTEFNTTDEKAELGDGGANMIHQRLGLSKNRMIMTASGLNAGAVNYMIMTAQMAKDNQISAGPPGRQPEKLIPGMKAGDKLAGVTKKFTYNTNWCLQTTSAKAFLHKEYKTPQYPRDKNDNVRFDQDMMEVSFVTLRNKNGPSNHSQTILISQSAGVQAALTEFHIVKEEGKGWGFGGSSQDYYCVFVPEVKLSRTQIRTKLKEEYKLRRAMNLLCEMWQMGTFWRDDDTMALLCDPQQLHDDLVKLGYDWDVLLRTRPWWTYREFEDGLMPFLSTKDILMLRKGGQLPYWMGEDKRPLPEYLKAMGLEK
jgi:hypothetical protein